LAPRRPNQQRACAKLGARVRAVLGPPDRRAGRSSDREWTYLLGSDGGDITPTLTIRFRRGRVAQVFAPRP